MATDEECRLVINTSASVHDRIVGFSTPKDSMRSKWGPPYYIRDERLPDGKQEIWRGDSQDEMFDQVEVERMRVALDALFALRGG